MGDDAGWRDETFQHCSMVADMSCAISRATHTAYLGAWCMLLGVWHRICIVYRIITSPALRLPNAMIFSSQPNKRMNYCTSLLSATNKIINEIVHYGRTLEFSICEIFPVYVAVVVSGRFIMKLRSCSHPSECRHEQEKTRPLKLLILCNRMHCCATSPNSGLGHVISILRIIPAIITWWLFLNSRLISLLAGSNWILLVLSDV